MTYEDLLYHEALWHVWEKWPIATPNSGFEKHLQRLEISKPLLKKQIEESLKKEESKEEVKTIAPKVEKSFFEWQTKFSYFCKICGIQLFDSIDIIHPKSLAE